MSKVTLDTGIDKIKDPADQLRFTSQLFEQIKTALNGGLSVSDNFDMKTLRVTFSAADTDVAIAHGLGRQPINYITGHVTAAMIVYGGQAAWNETNIYLRSSAIGTADILVY